MRLWLGLVFALSCAADRGPARPELAQLGPGARTSLGAHREAGPDKLAQNARCEACHADVATEWRGSLHAQAWDDPVFLSAYAIEPLPFCRGCHAPEAPLDEATSPARHLGVACITCHVPAGPAEGDAHVTFAPRAGDPEGCATCHQFEFPDPQDAAMQGTVEEHAVSPERDRSCASCHMQAAPGAAGRPGHGFRVWGDPARLRGALSASARRGTDRVVEVALAARGAGHAVPTGDMFRRLEVHGVAGEGADAIRAEPVVLARVFDRVRTDHGVRKLQVADERLPATGAPREARLVFPAPVGDRSVRWWVSYHRMGPREAALFGVDRDAEAIVMAEGRIPPDPRRGTEDDHAPP